MDEEAAASLWVFKTLFRSAKYHAEISKRLDLKIPDTVLFSDGRPTQWMRYDLVKKTIETRDIQKHDTKLLLDVLVSMKNFTAETNVQNEDAGTCLVWYENGGSEELTIKYLFQIFSSEEWQKQIVCIQAYVNPKEVLEGTLKPKTEESSDCDRKVLQIAKILADSQNEKFGYEEYAHDRLKWEVKELVCRFCLDKKNISWFCHASNILVGPGEVVPAGTKLEKDSLKEASIQFDTNYENYYKIYEPKTKNSLIDLVIILDCFQTLDICEDVMFKISRKMKKTRLIVVSLMSKDGKKVVVNHCSNNLLSKWFGNLASVVGLNKRPWVLSGIGIGANIALHFSVYRNQRTCTNLLTLFLINGFAYVDKTIKRCARGFIKEGKRFINNQVSGTLAQRSLLEGIIDGFGDLRSSLENLNFPIILVHSTENTFILPLHVQPIINGRGKHNVSSSINDCIASLPGRDARCHVAWLRAGHDVLEERTTYICECFAQIEQSLLLVHKTKLAIESNEKHNDTSIDVDIEDDLGLEFKINRRKNDGDDMFTDGTEYTRFDILNGGKKSKDIENESNESSAEDTDDIKKRRKQNTTRTNRSGESQDIQKYIFLTSAQERDIMSQEEVESRVVRRMFKEKERWQNQESVSNQRIEELHLMRDQENERNDDYSSGIKALLEQQEEKNKEWEIEMDDDDMEFEKSSAIPGVARLRLELLAVAQRQASMILKAKYIPKVLKDTFEQYDKSTKRLAEVRRAIGMIEAKIKTTRKKRKVDDLKSELLEISNHKEEIKITVHEFELKVKELRKELDKVNSAVQTDCILLEKKVKELEQVRDRLENIIESKEKEAQLKTDTRNMAIERRCEIIKLKGKMQHRIQQIQTEIDRVKNITTPYVDSSIWQSGVLQRMKTENLRRYLKGEHETILKQIERISIEFEKQKLISKESEDKLAILVQDLSKCRSQLSLITDTLALYHSGSLRKKCRSSVGNGEEEEKTEEEKERDAARIQEIKEMDEETLGLNALSVVELRNKKVADLNEEERMWTVLDAMMNDDDIHLNEKLKDGLFDDEKAMFASLQKETLERMLSFSEEINLSLPFLKNDIEILAFELIQTYTLGRSEKFIKKQDKKKAWERRRPEWTNAVVVDAISDELEDPQQDLSKVLVRKEVKSIFNVNGQRLAKREGRIHSFLITESDLISKLRVSVVYEGEFDVRGYIIGRISVAFYLKTGNEDDNKIIPVGYAPHESIALCTTQKMGRIVIEHDPGNAGIPIQSGEYQIVVASATSSRYSIDVSAEYVKPYEEAKQEAIEEVRNLIERVEQIDRDMEELDVSVYLGERKLHLVGEMLQEGRQMCDTLELSMAQDSKVLSSADADDEAQEEKIKAVIESVRKLELELAKWVRLAASREMEKNDVMKGLEDMRRVKREIIEERQEKLRRQSVLKNLGIDVDKIKEEMELSKKAAIEELKEKESPEHNIRDIEQPNADQCWEGTKPIFEKLADQDEQGITLAELNALLCHSGESQMGIQFVKLVNSRIDATLRTSIQKPAAGTLSGSSKYITRAKGIAVETDIDVRARAVLKEIELANAHTSEYMDSGILHGSNQRFPILILRRELNRELDRLLTLQVREREKIILKMSRARERGRNVNSNSSDSDSDESEENDVEADDEDAEAYPDDSDDNQGKAKVAATRGYCRACDSIPCSWKPPVDLFETRKRIIEVQTELDTVRMMDENIKYVDTVVAKSVKKGGVGRLPRAHLIRELMNELEVLHRSERLTMVDEELHASYATTEYFMETKALHGFTQVQLTENVCVSLEQERGKIIGYDFVDEVMDEIFEWMLEGWIFGERESTVPCEKIENEKMEEKYLIRGDPQEKWKAINEGLKSKAIRQKVVEENEKVDHHLNETENVLQFGLFTLTLMYFRAMTLLQKSKFNYGDDLKSKALGNNDETNISILSREARQREARERAMARAMHRAKLGEKIIQERDDARKNIEKEKLRKRLYRIKVEAVHCVTIQRVYRGHLGRLAAQKWALVRAEQLAFQSLQFAAAAVIQRAYRGYVGRCIAEDRREEIAEFMRKLRAEEAKEEEEDYWRRHPFQRFLRNLKALNKRAPPPELDELLVEDNIEQLEFSREDQ